MINMEAIRQRLLSRGLIIRRTTLADAPKVFELHRTVTMADLNCLTICHDELTLSMVKDMILASLLRGATLVAEKDGELIGYIQAHSSIFRRYAHVQANMKLFAAVDHRQFVGCGLLLADSLMRIMHTFPHVALVRIDSYQHSAQVVSLYYKLGFVLQAETVDGIFLESATPDTDRQSIFGGELHMILRNPDFRYVALLKYHEYLKKLTSMSRAELITLALNEQAPPQMIDLPS